MEEPFITPLQLLVQGPEPAAELAALLLGELPAAEPDQGRALLEQGPGLAQGPRQPRGEERVVAPGVEAPQPGGRHARRSLGGSGL